MKRRTPALKTAAEPPPDPASTGEAAPGDQSGARVGICEWFRPGERERVERLLADMKRLQITDLRTGVSWADWCRSDGEAWYGWLLPRLAEEVRVLPYFVSTPPSLAMVPKVSAPPRDPKWYADFLDQMITLFGHCFEWVELWSAPSDLREWDVELDPEWWIFSQMIGGAAYWAKNRGKRTLLGSSSAADPHWVRLMCERRVMQYVDAVGIQSLGARGEAPGDWPTMIGKVREVLDRYGSKAEVWITKTGYSTWRHDERQQLDAFVEALDAPAERLYWYSMEDLDPRQVDGEGARAEERECYFGLKRADGTPKLLYRLWSSGGLDAVRNTAWWGQPQRHRSRTRPALITGGAGFIGANLAHRLLSAGRPVLLFDNLSRPGVEENLQWLRDTHGDLLQIEVADVRDARALRGAVRRASQVFHFASQVAVTTSLVSPVEDFEVNARGTLNLLEALRAMPDPPPLVFTSTNKVYGSLSHLSFSAGERRYEPDDEKVRAQGIGEDCRLDFHSPYGCSKGAADQYIIDYARTASLPAVVFRMSCIYGPRQHGTEDQGWVAHFLRSAMSRRPITICGDGRQVRDVLFVEDLINAFLLAQKRIESLTGQAFNMGGGPANTISLIELLDLIAELHGEKPATTFNDWRPGDQVYYVSDTRKFQNATGWKARVDVRDGVARLFQWLRTVHERAPLAAVASKRRG